MLCLLHKDQKLREAFAVFTLMNCTALYPSRDIVLDSTFHSYYAIWMVHAHLYWRLLLGILLRSSSPNINVASCKNMLSTQNINPLPKFFKNVIHRKDLNVNYFIFNSFKWLVTGCLTMPQWVYGQQKLDLNFFFFFVGGVTGLGDRPEKWAWSGCIMWNSQVNVNILLIPFFCLVPYHWLHQSTLVAVLTALKCCLK